MKAVRVTVVDLDSRVVTENMAVVARHACLAFFTGQQATGSSKQVTLGAKHVDLRSNEVSMSETDWSKCPKCKSRASCIKDVAASRRLLLFLGYCDKCQYYAWIFDLDCSRTTVLNVKPTVTKITLQDQNFVGYFVRPALIAVYRWQLLGAGNLSPSLIEVDLAKNETRFLGGITMVKGDHRPTILWKSGLLQLPKMKKPEMLDTGTEQKWTSIIMVHRTRFDIGGYDNKKKQDSIRYWWI